MPRTRLPVSHRVLPVLFALAAGHALAHDTSNGAVSAMPCAAGQLAASLLFLDAPCAAPVVTSAERPDMADACTAANPSAPDRLARGVDQPLTHCARRLAWILALYGQITRHNWTAPGYTWLARRFDQLVQRARANDLLYEDLAPELQQAFIDAVHGALHPDDGPVPYVTITPASDPRMRQPISAVGALGLESAADRYIPSVASHTDALFSYGPPPVVRMDVDSPASIGVYGWDLRPSWPAPGPLLHWRVGDDGPGWQPDAAAVFTYQILDTSTAELVNVPGGGHAGLGQIVEVLDGWRLAPFQPYRDAALPEGIRALAATARDAIAHVREAARTPSALGPERHAFVIVRTGNLVQAVLYGSIGRFAPGVAEIHSMAVPARNMFPRLPLMPAEYRRETARGAAAHAIYRFVRHAQGHGATMLLYIGQDRREGSAATPAPHDAL
ncbi:hypothetical protein [Cupriavidus plantarum]|uniref:hypothetical protein n=1 Tax=Cupriavidus plantarum TaxID=942865 RepID=UPI001B010CD3|nr:hypothetical protein [Cupriavidus plantarum]CAG2129240.1 hypothetical protein LMG26296_01527 [Cupriavidus plantarum]SMR66339.1 hypothetical protein SAMN05421735_1220 [Cupriavidus plantarum]